MEINKQLFEDVLLGKLKGTFVVRNGKTFNSKYLKRSKDTFLGADYYYPYALFCDINDGVLFTNFYTENGFSRILGNSSIDIVDFISETNIKENELKITIPEGHEIDWQESAKQEKIVFKNKEVFKKKDTKPRSWKEYLELSTGFDGCGINWNMNGGIQTTGLHHRGKAIVPTEYGAPFIAMM